jgi:hypothetical protein
VASFSGLTKLELLLIHGNEIPDIPDGALKDLSSLQVHLGAGARGKKSPNSFPTPRGTRAGRGGGGGGEDLGSRPAWAEGAEEKKSKTGERPHLERRAGPRGASHNPRKPFPRNKTGRARPAGGREPPGQAEAPSSNPGPGTKTSDPIFVSRVGWGGFCAGRC